MKSYVIIYLLKVGVYCMDIFALEQLRKKAIIKFFLFMLLDLIVIGFFIYSYFNIDKVSNIVIFGFFFYFVLSVMFKNSLGKNFEKTVKTNCIQKILDDIVRDNGKVEWRAQTFMDCLINDLSDQKYPDANNINCHYSYPMDSGIDMLASGINENNQLLDNKQISFSFNPRESRLFDFRSVTTDDSFEGIYKGVNFKIIETEFTSGRGEDRTTPFKGCWMIIKSNKQFNSHTIISKRTYFFQKDLYKLDIPIPDFKKKYKVYTNNLQETSSLMSSDLCNLLTGVKNKTSMAIYDSNIILAIQMRGDLFKLGSIFKRVDDPKQYTKFVQEISSLLSIIGRLKSIENLGLEQAEPVEAISE